MSEEERQQQRAKKTHGSACEAELPEKRASVTLLRGPKAQPRVPPRGTGSGHL